MALPWRISCRVRLQKNFDRLWIQKPLSQQQQWHQRNLTTSAAAWHTQTSLPSSRVQIYTSRSHDPYLNLSAEHFLLQNSHPESTILFLYTNDPCIVIGRNQNPWLEVNLGLLGHFQATVGKDDVTCTDSKTNVSLVRRRSGGGAVFHDRGNVNYSVICPPAVFDRDRHAEMVVRALGRLGVDNARVNERHDIVVVDDSTNTTTEPPHGSSLSSSAAAAETTFKISGSAYKLTRLRSLHHGTCLLSSPNLGDIGRLLRSPAEPFIKARGVESVRSRIRNVGVPVESFMDAVMAEFGDMYGGPDVEATFGEGIQAPDFTHDQIQKGYRELTSREWLYNQTPQFTFSTHPSVDDPRERPPLPRGLPDNFRATITARHGEIQQADVTGFDGISLQSQHLHTIKDWHYILKPMGSNASEPVAKWFNSLFGISSKEA